MEGILRLREIVYQLRKRLTILESRQSVVETTLDTASVVVACADYITLQTNVDATGADLVILKRNKQGDTAYYWPITTADPANGITIVDDKNGKKFELVR